ncbi:conserved hypothetical protein [Talaromyces stipitatus ATCC 10500]|uniref:Transferase family protein n=1 Tax=Talaromyces stipitatus (strain ATCC 10500 / CBS 375.48 / QM 6759 / NRRL 1006) TaxID=441959 RepID=B8M6D5_TALSN|nr:uncharacterized protein TSTA_026210 [Talaromyces stipitatus ATCC 10500]EED19310.1 conserved hypothetical protein [Talaromyces stipitatus ATCC 10500]
MPYYVENIDEDQRAKQESTTKVTGAMGSTTYLIHADPSFEGVYQLSPADLQIPARGIRQAFVYSTEKETPLDETKARRLIASLQESLKTLLKPFDKEQIGSITYPQLLGRVVRPDGKPPYIAVEKSSNIPFKVAYRLDIDFESLSPEQHFPADAIPKTDFATGLDDIQFLSQHNCAVQLTFINGGFVLVFQIHHIITDAYGYVGFMRQWLQRTKVLMADGPYEDGVSSTVTSNIHDKTELLKDFDESLYGPDELRGLSKWKTLYKEAPAAKTNPFSGNGDVQSKIFRFSNESLETLRAEMHTYTENRPTIFESVMALTWQCLARARTAPETSVESTTSSGFFSADMRQRLVPPLATDFFGNAVTAVLARLPLSSLLDPTNIATVIRAIQDTLRKDATDPNLRSINKYIFSQLRVGKIPPNDLLERDVFFNSWEHLYPSLDIMDIGVGRFRTLRYLMDSPITPSYVLIMPSYGLRQKSTLADSGQYPGGIELNVQLLRHQMEKLEEDEEWARYQNAGDIHEDSDSNPDSEFVGEYAPSPLIKIVKRNDLAGGFGGVQPFYIAITNDNLDTLRLLLEFCPSSLSEGLKNRRHRLLSILDLACRGGDFKTTRFLLDRDPRLGVMFGRDSHGGSALCLLLAHHDVQGPTRDQARDQLARGEAFTYELIERGDPVRDAVSRMKHPTPGEIPPVVKTVLGEVVIRGSPQLVSRLIAGGANVHERQFGAGDTSHIMDLGSGSIPLHIVSGHWNLPAAKVLLDNHGSQISIAEMVSMRDSELRLPLHLAARSLVHWANEDALPVNETHPNLQVQSSWCSE